MAAVRECECCSGDCLQCRGWCPAPAVYVVRIDDHPRMVLCHGCYWDAIGHYGDGLQLVLEGTMGRIRAA